jgi:hypothetical protein
MRPAIGHTWTCAPAVVEDERPATARARYTAMNRREQTGSTITLPDYVVGPRTAPYCPERSRPTCTASKTAGQSPARQI